MSSPLLQLWGWNEPSGAILRVLQLALPPVMVILVDDLDDVSHSEPNACFLARNEFIFGWVIFKLRPYVDLKRDGDDQGCKNLTYNAENLMDQRTDRFRI